MHGQFCVVPGGSSTRWTLTAPATSLLLRLNPVLMQDTAEHMRLQAELAPAIHIRDPQIERIGWMMQAEEHDGHPGGRIFADSLASALAARLLALQTLTARRPATAPVPMPAPMDRPMRLSVDGAAATALAGAPIGTRPPPIVAKPLATGSASSN